MRRLTSTIMFLVLILSGLTSSVFSKEPSCSYISSSGNPIAFTHPLGLTLTSGNRTISFIRGDKELRYSVNANGPDWKFHPHTWDLLFTTMTRIECPTCSEKDGLQIHIGDIVYSIDPAPSPDSNYPKTGIERMKSGYEQVPYSLSPMSEPDLIPVASREEIKLGPYTGYAVFYNIKEGWFRRQFSVEQIKNIGAAGTVVPDGPAMGVLVVYLQDECAQFNATITTPWNNKLDWGFLDAFLRDVSIQKTTIPYVRPKCPDESIECFREALGLKN